MKDVLHRGRSKGISPAKIANLDEVVHHTSDNKSGHNLVVGSSVNRNQFFSIEAQIIKLLNNECG